MVHGIMVACNCCLTEPVVHVYIVHTYIYTYDYMNIMNEQLGS